MNVKELIEALKGYPEDAEVIVSRDEEGNGYSLLYSIDEGTVPPNQLDRGYTEDFYSDSHTDDQCCLEPGERKSFRKVICLWP